MDLSQVSFNEEEKKDSESNSFPEENQKPKLNFNLWSSTDSDDEYVQEALDEMSMVEPVEERLDLLLEEPVVDEELIEEDWSNPILEDDDEELEVVATPVDTTFKLKPVLTVDAMQESAEDSSFEETSEVEDAPLLDDVLFYGRNTMTKHSRWRKVSESNRVKRNSKSRKYDKLKYASNLKGAGATERLVDGEGNPLSKDSGSKLETSEQFGKLLDQVERTGDVALSEKAIIESDSFVKREKPELEVVYPFKKKLATPSTTKKTEASSVRVKQRVAEAEKEFFKSTGLSWTRAMSDAEYSVAYRELLRKDAIRTEGRTKRKEPSQYLVNPIMEGIRSFEKFGQYSMVWTDLEILEFLVRFRYASAKTIGRMLGVTEGTAKTRLSKLKKLGLAGSIDLFGSTSLWVCTNAGKLLCGVELPLVTPRKLSLPLIPHQTVVNNIAAQLWKGQTNCLMLDDFPMKNRVDAKGRTVYGETLVSETEIASSFRTMTRLDKSEIYRSRLQKETESMFARWREAAAESSSTRNEEKMSDDTPERTLRSPEQHYGNEWLYVLLPPFALKRAYHYPDLVIQRDRSPDGSPRSIAVEVETNNKKVSDEYLTTLETYKADKNIYGSVIWVCRTQGAARAVERAARQIGLWQEGRIDIVPIITEKGVHEGRDLWLM